jgi:hypothetical protein
MAGSGWYPDRMWLPFLVGWLIKVWISKYSGGRMLRHARSFFIGMILAEASIPGISVILRVLSRGGFPLF